MLQNPNVVVDNPVTVANFPATQPVSGSVSVTGTVDSNITNASIAVTGPLTDAQLRATPVPVSVAGSTAGTSTVSRISVSNSAPVTFVSR